MRNFNKEASARERPRLHATAIGGSDHRLVLHRSHLAAKRLGKFSGFVLGRKVDAQVDPRPSEGVAKGRRLEMLVVEPSPHRLHRLDEHFLTAAALDRKHPDLPVCTYVLSGGALADSKTQTYKDRVNL